MRARVFVVLGGVAAISAIATIALALSSGGAVRPQFSGKLVGERDAAAGNVQATPGEGRADGWDAYMAAARTYPANVIPPAIAARAEATFERLAAKDAKKGDPGAKGHHWKLYGPRKDAMQPGVLAFSGATNSTASRITALVVSPDCSAKSLSCTLACPTMSPIWDIIPRIPGL